MAGSRQAWPGTRNIAVFGLVALLGICIEPSVAKPALPANFTGAVFIVDARGLESERQLAASVAVGLLNRYYEGPTALLLNSPNDWKWAAGIRSGSELAGSRWVAASDADIIAFAVAVGAATSVVGYNPQEAWSLATTVTMCGIHSAIPVPNLSQGLRSSSLPQLPFTAELVEITNAPPRSAISDWEGLNITLGLDALGGNVSDTLADSFMGARHAKIAANTAGRWVDELEATLWAWSHLFSDCLHTDEVVAIQRPEVLSHGFLADLIVSQQMFVFFLPTMCVPGPQQVLFRSLVSGAYAAGKQLKVMGYSIEDEVVADCSLHHTEVSLVSDWCPNLSFYSRMAPVSSTLLQIPSKPAPTYNPNHTYVAIVNSDGDNMQMENNGNRDGMEARVQLCSQEGSVCPPLAWTMSNQLATYAPFQLRWYYSQAQKTGRDTFLMGPSGFGFLHPAAIAPESPLLAGFVAGTVKAAQQLSMTSYVHWDVDSNGLSQRSMAWQYHHSQGNETGSTPAPQLPQGQAASTAPSRQLQSSRRLAMANPQQASGLVQVISQALRNVFGRSTARSNGTAENQLAREAYIRRFEGTQIDTVFAPGEYHIPEWVGNVAGVQEQYRWGKEMATEEAVRRADTLPRGTVGYIYKIFEVEMKEYEAFGKSVAKHVHLVDHRQLHDIALQKKFAGKAA